MLTARTATREGSREATTRHWSACGAIRERADSQASVCAHAAALQRIAKQSPLARLLFSL